MTLMTPHSTPLQSLQLGRWFKLICGASYQASSAVRNLTLAYALAGADCIDVAADPAVVTAAKAGLVAAEQVALREETMLHQRIPRYVRPWLMVSVSAGEDPHFRKAWFDPALCPADCSRPCERICPADAIASKTSVAEGSSGIIRDRCYGCGRCLPVCPLDLIKARSHPTTLDAVAQKSLFEVDALEIHTQVGQLNAFAELWQTIKPWSSHIKLISISCPDGPDLVAYLQALQSVIRPSSGLRLGAARPDIIQPTISSTLPDVIWQTDGRPMSGDIGKGTTHAAIRLAQKVLASNLTGYVQLAGGTNQHTVSKLKHLNLLNRPHTVSLNQSKTVAGIAYGSFARRLLMPLIEQTLYLEENPHALWKAVELAESLVGPLKQSF